MLKYTFIKNRYLNPKTWKDSDKKKDALKQATLQFDKVKIDPSKVSKKLLEFINGLKMRRDHNFPDVRI